MSITIGQSFSCSVTVSAQNTARTVGSGNLDVFATPMMIALMEQAAAGCIAPQLDAGQTSVGVHIDVQHSAATPVGMAVQATATVTAVAGRQVTFAVTAGDDAGEIGSGRHTRAIVDAGRFLAKTQQKLGGK
ncbi:MAG: thioesterase family protein [Ruminococcaceae bacterium]|nr:thioesterase family protein [Oscillospiraceae bacterium]